jgi:putative hemolysin
MTVIIIKIIMFLISLVMLAYFAGTETALTSLPTMSFTKIKKESPGFSDILDFWETKPNEVLATILLGTNLTLVANGVIAASIAIDVLGFTAGSKTVIFTAASLCSIILTLVAGDIAPKIYSRYKPEEVTMFGLPMLVRFSRASTGFNRFVISISEKVLSLFGQRAKKEKPFLQPEELKILLTSDETIPLSTPARRMMKNIIDFAKIRVSQVMIPRDKISAVSLDQPPEQIIEQIIEKEYSRVPVYRGNLDNIVGIIYSKDLALAWRGGSLFVINDLIRPAYFVPASARIDKVLREFKTGHQHMAVVVDEFGSTTGIATIEDLVEEIVGEIWDEYDIQESTTFPLPEGGWMIKAGESLKKINDELLLDLPANDFDTLNGWALDLFGKIPKAGESVKWGALEVEVIDADKKKILRLKIKKT